MTQVFSPRSALRATTYKKSLDPLPFFAKKPYKYVGGNLIDESIIKLVEHEIRKATGRWTWPAGSMVPPGTTGEEESQCDDLRSAAYLALVTALPKYDPNRGKFRTFAEPVARNAIRDALTPAVKNILGGKYSLVRFDQHAYSKGGESFSLSAVLPDARPNSLAESFWQHLQPLMTEQQFAALFLRCRIRMRPSNIARWLGVSKPRVNELLGAALRGVRRIVATDPVGRSRLVAAQFYAGAIPSTQYNPRFPPPGFVGWLASMRFEGERWARGSDPVQKSIPKSRKLPAFSGLPSEDALCQVEPRTWQDAATIIAARAAIQLGVSLRGIKGPRPVAGFSRLAFDEGNVARCSST